MGRLAAWAINYANEVNQNYGALLNFYDDFSTVVGRLIKLSDLHTVKSVIQ